MICVQCNKPISNNAGTEENPLCPVCYDKLEKWGEGNINTEEQVDSSWSAKNFVAAIPVIIVMIIVVSFMISTTPTDWKQEDNSTMAYIQMQYHVKENLKSPRSAKFPTLGHRGVVYRGNQKYGMSSYVDAQNAFGAEIRTKFWGDIKQVGPDE